MKAIGLTEFGGPNVLRIVARPAGSTCGLTAAESCRVQQSVLCSLRIRPVIGVDMARR
jgi:hypothetical protein